MSRSNDRNGGGGVRLVRVDAGSDGQRIDNFLMRELKGVPRSRIYRLLRKGEVRVNRGRVRAEARLAAGDEVRIPPVRVSEEAGTALPVPAPLLNHLASCIVYEDDALLVINKPAGLAVHGGSGIQTGLIEALRQLRPDARFLELVHRLDRDTSGLIMIAKKRSTLTTLHEALRGDGVDKRYLALAVGSWPVQRKRVEAPLLKNTLRSGERVVRVSADGKPAVTLFKVLERFPEATLVEASPVTGRTHQIRVHAQFAGCPLAGDDKYGNRDVEVVFREKGLKRLFLHAFRLFVPLDGRRLELEAPLPAELESFLAALRSTEE
ncbi:MAG: 23S rRNA pseudouridine(955/2504/2580) synthase RluC [Spongiibacteraceae bacterium]|jgi:23S rRNA pseudouridine955/2504/2580 synthase|nr:23S rRNA pseudouridine(955/2504/2580) synthase RluC [Spongiibacteraceae bacterium]